jgi:hypothetical protein
MKCQVVAVQSRLKRAKKHRRPMKNQAMQQRAMKIMQLESFQKYQEGMEDLFLHGASVQNQGEWQIIP